jgi:hypothetical protein
MGTTMASPPIQQESRRGEVMTRLFGDLQIARFNELYYQRRASWMRTLATGANIVSAVAASAVLTHLLTSGGSALGLAMWQAITGAAAVFATVGPVLGLTGKVNQLDKAAFGHCVVRGRIQALLTDLKTSDLDDTHIVRSKEIEALRTALSALDERARERVKMQCWDQTLREFPSESAWALV